jgi:hypothetical protein
VTAIAAVLVQAGPPLDPESYGTAFGPVIGALILVIVLLLATLAALVIKGTPQQQKREEALIGFIDRHRKENTEALGTMAQAVVASSANMVEALQDQVRVLDTVLVVSEGMQRAQARRSGGNGLTPAEIEQIIRTAHDVVQGRRGRPG